MGRFRRIDEITETVRNLSVKKRTLQSQLKTIKKEARKLNSSVVQKGKALELVKQVAIKTQSQLQYHLSDMVSAGLNAVFDSVYDFKVIFVDRRGKTECDLFFEKDGELVPSKFSGGGALDVAAFCLRCAAWSMSKQYRNVLVLDEPLTHLKGEAENIRAIKVMHKLSHELGLQIICVNDERASREDIVENSDRVFFVKQNNKGVSKIEVLK